MNEQDAGQPDVANDEGTTGRVFDLQKFSIHDGPGIRTTVFMKGCPLECLWCHNPESQSRAIEISLMPEKCIGCGYCFRACPQGCHMDDGEQRQFLRERCTHCGTCAAECHAGALEAIGSDMTVAAVMEDVLKDRPFYETSGGGVTLSGGEPMAQFAFTLALARTARRAGLHVCMETCGYAPWAHYAALLPFVDLFLFDYKESDPARHRAATGVPSEPILDNLRRLDEQGAALVLRCPIIPGCNARDDHFRAIADTANSLRGVKEINVMAYHPLGEAKRHRLGKAAGLPETAFPDDATVAAWVGQVARQARVPVQRG